MKAGGAFIVYPSPIASRDFAVRTLRVSFSSSWTEVICSTRLRTVLGRRPKRWVICCRSTFRRLWSWPSCRPNCRAFSKYSSKACSNMGGSLRVIPSGIIASGNLLRTTEMNQVKTTSRRGESPGGSRASRSCDKAGTASAPGAEQVRRLRSGGAWRQIGHYLEIPRARREEAQLGSREGRLGDQGELIAEPGELARVAAQRSGP